MQVYGKTPGHCAVTFKDVSPFGVSIMSASENRHIIYGIHIPQRILSDGDQDQEDAPLRCEPLTVSPRSDKTTTSTPFSSFVLRLKYEFNKTTILSFNQLLLLLFKSSYKL